MLDDFDHVIKCHLTIPLCDLYFTGLLESQFLLCCDLGLAVCEQLNTDQFLSVRQLKWIHAVLR